MRLRASLLALIALLLGIAPAASAAARRGTPEVVTSLRGASQLLGASSAAGHGDAYAVFRSVVGKNIYTVVFGDRNGHLHRFDLPTEPGSFPFAVRFAALDGGGGMALWDDSRTNRVLARSWRPDGSLGSVEVALQGVHVVHGGDSDFAQWQLRTDGEGTVAVASPGAPPRAGGSIVAAVRDPGLGFSPSQELTPGGDGTSFERQLRLSPLASDGFVAVSWGSDSYADGPGARATRPGRGAPFGPPEPAPFVSDRGLSVAQPTSVTEDGQPVTVSARVAALCPCRSVRVFTWGTGERLLTFARFGTRTAASGDGYVVHPDTGGTFDRAELATASDGALAVRRARPGEVAFARVDSGGELPGALPQGHLVVIPYGPAVPLSRRAPRARFGDAARATARRVLVPVSCDRDCTVAGTDTGPGRLPVRDFRAARASSRPEAFQVVYLLATPGRRTRLHLRLRATDDAGHSARIRATFALRSGGWCRVGAPRC